LGAPAPGGSGVSPSLDDALDSLRGTTLGAAADVIARRVAQTKPKMRLTETEAIVAAAAVLSLVPDSEPLSALHLVMPRSTVELCRAVRERGVPAADAEAIARYLSRMVAVMQFRKLATFDENHSHVTGRDWEQIDYRGEGMTWQTQKDYWAPRGVPSFKRAAYVHAYFSGAARMKHFARVYRPTGKMSNVPAPD